MNTNVYHFASTTRKGYLLCGLKDNRRPATYHAIPCKACDKLVRDYSRSLFGLPPFTAREHNALYSKLWAGRAK